MPKGDGTKLVLQIFPNGEIYDEHGIRLGVTNWAEAVPVPPHGRLIDADAMAESWKGRIIEGSIEPLLNARPTILKAELPNEENIMNSIEDEKQQMNGIYIRDMKMPVNCYHCSLMCYDPDKEYFDSMRTGAYICVLTGKLIDNTKLDNDCPLIPVPSHGDLIDCDAYRDEFVNGVYALCNDDSNNDRANAIIDLYDSAPTLIPADESDMDSFIHIFEEDDDEDGMDSFIRIFKD